jgi:hypothetical protein
MSAVRFSKAIAFGSPTPSDALSLVAANLALLSRLERLRRGRTPDCFPL